MEFEFDQRKSRSNLKKHGIDFSDAQALWEDPDLIVIPARTIDEPRFLVVGKMGEHYWSGIVTHREDRIRIIENRDYPEFFSGLGRTEQLSEFDKAKELEYQKEQRECELKEEKSFEILQ